MVNKISFFVALIFFSFLLISCSSTTVIKEEKKIDTLAIIGNEVITAPQFEEFYFKNNGGPESIKFVTDSSKRQFLDLLIKYKLKVKEAFRHNYQEEPETKNEIAEYKKSLAIPYILDKELIDPAIKLIYERKKKNMQVGGILLRTNFANSEDSIAKAKLASALIDSLNKGYNLNELAIRHSQLRNVSVDSGLIGWFTGGVMHKDLEDAVYNLKVGELTKTPIKIPTGLFIIKLLKTEDRSGGKKIAHIMFKFKEMTLADSLKVKERANQVLQRIRKGESFEEMAKLYSEEVETKDDGGNIGTFERDPMLGPREFFDVGFKLKEGEVSDLVYSPMGVHIIKINKIEPLQSYSSLVDKIKEEYNQTRGPSDRTKYISTLKAKFNFKYDMQNINEFWGKIDSNAVTGSPNWDSLVTGELTKKPFIYIQNSIYNVDEAVKQLKTHPELRGIGFTPSGFKNILDKLSEIEILNFKADRIDQEYSEFAGVMKEYIDGLLLFRAEQSAVWNKLVVNDSSLRNYFEINKESFKFPDRVNYSEIFFLNDSSAQATYKTITDTIKIIKPTKKSKKSKPPVEEKKLTFDDYIKRYSARDDYPKMIGKWGLLGENEDPLTKHAFSMKVGEISKPIPFENGFSIIKLNFKDTPRLKKYEECGPELSTKFQEFETKRLEQSWIEDLKQIFSLKVFYNNLSKVLIQNKN